MSRYTYQPVGKCNYEAAMTFEEIAKEMGISRKGAHMLYANAMKKLRQRKVAFIHLLELHHELEANRAAAAEVKR